MNLRKTVAMAALVLGAVGLVGCDAIPDSGPVNPGLTNLQQTDQQVLFAPTGPVAGATQEDIVRGFASAASSSMNDYAIAREFLTPEYSMQWDPYSEVLVDDGARRYSSEGATVGEMSVPAVAYVDSNGVLTPVPPGPNTEVRYEFERVDDEWRISSAPTGIILDRATFTAAWSSHQVYFNGPEGRLVPETRWFLSRASTATQIISELLEGPSEQMAEVLTSAFPAETALSTNSVPVIDGTARIELTAEMHDAEDEVIEDVVRQVAASLQAVSGVSDFELVSEGTIIAAAPVGRPEAENPIGTDTQAAAVIQDGEFGLIASSQVTPIEDLGSTVVELDPIAVTLAGDQESAVVQASDGISYASNGDLLKIEGTPGQLEPSLDPFGNVWTYSRENPGTLLVVAPGEQVSEVDAPWLEGLDPAAVRISPEGARVAALVPSGDGGSEVVVAGIIREDGLPARTTDMTSTQLWADGDPLDFDWVDESRFATLTSTGSGSKVTIGMLGSFPTEAGSVPDGQKLSGGGSRASLRVLDGNGNLFAPQGSGWQRQASEIELLAKRG